MSDRINITFIPSDNMTNMSNIVKEDNLIRLPKRIRTLLDINIGDKLIIGFENTEIKVLEVSTAYLGDTKIKDPNVALLDKETSI